MGAAAAAHIEKKVVVVQAGTAGIGLATAARLLADGFAVVISSRRKENVAAAQAKLDHPDAHGVVGHAGVADDRTRLAEVAASLRTDASIHGLVLNAAASTSFGPLLNTTEASFVKMLHTNLLSGFLTLQEFARRGMLNQGGSVVFVSSIGAYSALPAIGAYSVTKTALLGLSRALAEELGDRGEGLGAVRVNCVAPGIIRTRFSERMWRSEDGRERNVREMPVGLALQRLGTPEDIAKCISFLIGPDSSYVTGECLVAAGGMRSRL